MSFWDHVGPSLIASLVVNVIGGAWHLYRHHRITTHHDSPLDPTHKDHPKN